MRPFRTVGSVVRALLLAGTATVVSCASPSPFHARPVRLVSSALDVDHLMAQARAHIRSGDFPTAADELQTLYTDHPKDPLAAVARLLHARLLLVRDDRAQAHRVAIATATQLDPRLEQMLQLVLGILSAHDADVLLQLADEETARTDAGVSDGGVSIDSRRATLELARIKANEALGYLTPLDGTLPDRAETAEVLCGLFTASLAHDALRGLLPRTEVDEASNDSVIVTTLASLSVDGTPWLPTLLLAFEQAEPSEVYSALQALVLIEALAEEGTVWLPGTPRCDVLEQRRETLRRLAERIYQPAVVADILDTLPPSSSVRGTFALRLSRLLTGRPVDDRYLAYLADLPDDTTLNTPPDLSDPSRRMVIGVLAPLTQEQADVGASIVRGVQYAVEGFDALYVMPEDQGTSPESIDAAFARFAARHVVAVVGVTRADLAQEAAVQAEKLHVPLWLLEPTSESLTHRDVHAAGAVMSARVEAFTTALCGANEQPVPVCGALRGVTIESAPGASQMRDALRSSLASAGANVHMGLSSRPGTGSLATPSVFVGLLGRDALESVRSVRVSAPRGRWFEARSVLPGTTGTWVGQSKGPVFDQAHRVWCERTGEAPDVLTLLAFDSVRDAVSLVRPHACSALCDSSRTTCAIGCGHTLGDTLVVSTSPETSVAGSETCAVRPEPVQPTLGGFDASVSDTTPSFVGPDAEAPQ